jgi:hypothetical protein
MRYHFNYDKFQILVTDEYSDEFEDLQNEMAVDQSHPLWKNYFNIDVDVFDLHAITLIGNTPVGFQGCQTKDIWNGSSRAMTRTYLHKTATHLYKEIGVENTKLYTSIFKEVINKPFFISREITRSPEIDWRSFNYFCKWLKNGTNMPLCWDNKLYEMSKDSWQHIVWLQNEQREIRSLDSNLYK